MKTQSKLLCLILVFLLINVGSPELTFGFVEEEDDPTQEQEAQESIQLEENASANNDTEKQIFEANKTHTIDIGSSTLNEDVATIPGVYLSDNILYFDQDTDESASHIISGTTTSRAIEVKAGVTAHIIIDGLDMHTPSSPIRTAGTAKILLRNSNRLFCTSNSSNDLVPLAGITVLNLGILIIDGEPNGILDVKGGITSPGIGISYLSSAFSCSIEIWINGGTINATGGFGGAGIGYGMMQQSSQTIKIHITGGNITTTGGSFATGIGIGFLNPNQEVFSSIFINITGGSITATGTSMYNDIGGHVNAPNLFSGNIQVNITGGSVLPTRGLITNPTNGDFGAPDSVNMFTFNNYDASKPFTMTTSGTASRYQYKGIAHEDGNVYAWLAQPGVVQTKAPTVENAIPANVSAPNQVLKPYHPGQAVMEGTYELSGLPLNIKNAYFEWGTSEAYGMQSSVINQINTTAIAEHNINYRLEGLAAGDYHYRLVLEIENNGVTTLLNGENIKFTVPSLSPSLDVLADTIINRQATLHGIYELNGQNFEHGVFEVSIDGGNTWFTPTSSSEPISITETIGVNSSNGYINNSTQTPSVRLHGLPDGTTIQYRMTVRSTGGNETVTKSFNTPWHITIEYIDLDGNVIQPPTTESVLQGAMYRATAPNISNYTNVGVMVDGGERDINKSYYTNPSVSQSHTIQFVYDTTSTMLSLSVPSRLVFSSFASDGGKVSAPDYQITNHSSLPVDVTLSSFAADVNQLDGLSMVQGTPENEDQIQLHLVGGRNFNTLHDLQIGTLSNGFMGRLKQRNQPDSIGEFTFEGNYRGRFGIPRHPRLQATFTFELVLPKKLTP